jgi:L-cysteine/cystine lyase
VVKGRHDAKPTQMEQRVNRLRAVQNGVVAHDEPTFEEARSLFPALEEIAYLNAGTFGPLARATVEAMQAWVERDLSHGRSGSPYFEQVMGLRAQLRERLAAFVGADPLQVALTASTTDGCNIVLAGLGLRPEDEIVTTSAEHFGLLGALHASGARVVVVEPEPEAIRRAVTPRTRLLALSQVLWTNGRVLPVRTLREQTGVPVLVDGAQSVGAIPVSAHGLDFLTISGQKWLCGPDGTGALVVADPERLRVAAPSYFSQASYDPDGAFVPREGAPRFEPNWIGAASLAGLIAALDTRPGWAFAHAAALAERARALLAPHVELDTPAERATLVAFRAAGDPAEVVARLYAAGVHVREIPTTRQIRISCGWWTSDGDVERLVAALTA